MGALVALARVLFGRLSFCALNGGLVGAIAGLLFGLLQGEFPNQPLAIGELLPIALLLGLVGWVVVLVVVGMWIHYGAAAVAWPALLNALLTALLTVWLNNLLLRPELASLIGLLVGILVGTILCRLCARDRGRTAAHV